MVRWKKYLIVSRENAVKKEKEIDIAALLLLVCFMFLLNTVSR